MKTTLSIYFLITLFTFSIGFGCQKIPSACFKVSSTEVKVGEKVTFTSCSLNGDRHIWDFGDGDGSLEKDPSHSYSDPGTYSAFLEVSSKNGKKVDYLVTTIVVTEPKVKINTQTISISSFEWIETGTVGLVGYGYYVSKKLNILNQDVVDKGVLLGYLKNPASNTWILLPLTLFLDGYQTNFLFQYDEQQVQLELYDSDLLTLGPTATMTFKFVAISETGNIPNLDKLSKDFNLLKKELNIIN